MMGPKVAKRRTNRIVAWMALDRQCHLRKVFCSRFRGDIQDGAEKAIHTGGALSCRERLKIGKTIYSRGNTGSISPEKKNMPAYRNSRIIEIEKPGSISIISAA